MVEEKYCCYVRCVSSGGKPLLTNRYKTLYHSVLESQDKSCEIKVLVVLKNTSSLVVWLKKGKKALISQDLSYGKQWFSSEFRISLFL